MKLKGGESVSIVIPPPAPAEPQPEDIPIEILFEDSEVVVVNKVAGMVVHPGANPEGTLVNALLAHCKDLSGIGELRPGIVHRIDKDTSGHHRRRQERPLPQRPRRTVQGPHHQAGLPGACLRKPQGGQGAHRVDHRPSPDRAQEDVDQGTPWQRRGNALEGGGALPRDHTDTAAARDRAHPPDQGPPLRGGAPAAGGRNVRRRRTALRRAGSGTKADDQGDGAAGAARKDARVSAPDQQGIRRVRHRPARRLREARSSV